MYSTSNHIKSFAINETFTIRVALSDRDQYLLSNSGRAIIAVYTTHDTRMTLKL